MDKQGEGYPAQTTIYNFSTAELDLTYEEKPIKIARMKICKKPELTQQEFKF